MAHKQIRIETDIFGDTVDRFSFTLRALNAGLTPVHPDYVTAAQLAQSIIANGLEGMHSVRPAQLDA